LLSKERGQASGGIIDIPTRLAPRDTSILCRQTRKFIKKGGKDIYKKWRDYTKTHKKKQQNTGKETEKTTKQPKNRLRESIIR